MDGGDKRNEKGQFAEGRQGGPGRKKMLEELRIRVHEMTHTHLERLCGIAATGEDKDAIAAVKLMWAYGYGNPAQVVTNEDGSPLRLGLVVLPEQKFERDPTD